MEETAATSEEVNASTQQMNQAAGDELPKEHKKGQRHQKISAVELLNKKKKVIFSADKSGEIIPEKA